MENSNEFNSYCQLGASNDYSDSTNPYDNHHGEVYRCSGSVFVVSKFFKAVPKQFQGTMRSTITCFSSGAGIRMRRYLRECIAEYDRLITLTYPGIYSQDGKVIKNHLRRFLQEMRREFMRQKIGVEYSEDTFYQKNTYSAFWFLEFQERGAPHFHIFATWAPDKDWIARRWYEIVNSEDERHRKAGTRVEFLRSGRAGTVKYAAKYAQKMEQKVCPAEFLNIGRWWGISGRRGVVSAATAVTVEDAKKSEVRYALGQLIRTINLFLWKGELEPLVSEGNSRVFIGASSYVMQQLRLKVAMLAGATRRWPTIFQDAELDGY